MSVLSEAEVKSLDEIFSRDPFDLTKQDRATIVSAMRKQRENWLAAEAGGAKRAPKQAKPATKTADSALDLSDLGL